MRAINRGMGLMWAVLLRSVLPGLLIGVMAIEGPLLQVVRYEGRGFQASRKGFEGSRVQGFKGPDSSPQNNSSATTLDLSKRRLEPSAILSNLGIGAQAAAQPPPPGGECLPPDCIPLPSPITLGRSLSDFSIDNLNLSGEPLTITYTIFNSRDEEIGEPLLVTTLAPGVTLVTDPDKTSPLPDQPTPPDGRLAFVLPSIPPFGQVQAKLTVQVPNGSGNVPVDTGAKAFGNIRTRSVKASLAPTTIPQTLAVAEDFLACTIDTSTNCPDGARSPADKYVQQKVGAVGCDVDDIFAFVRDKVGFESYRGSLRGARGTIWSMAGNALDQSSLLVGMLRACGIPARYVSGVLGVPDAQQLILSMFPPITRAVGGLPPADLPQLGNVDINDLLLNASQFLPGADKISDPANDPDLLSETQQHYWVEYYNGSGWTALDATFAGATTGQTFASADERFAEIDDAIRHKVRFRLDAELLPLGIAEKFARGATAFGLGSPEDKVRFQEIGSFLVQQQTVLDQTFRTVELVGEPVSIGHFVDSSGLAGIGISVIFNTYSPWMQIGDRPELIRGEDYEEAIPSAAISGAILSGLSLRMRVIDAQGNEQDFERALVDRIGFAIRSGGHGTAAVVLDGTAPAVTNVDVTTVGVFSSLQYPAAAIRDHDAARDAQLAVQDGASESETVHLARRFMTAEERAILSTFTRASDEVARGSQRLTGARGYVDSPLLFLSGARTTLVDGQVSIGVFIDLLKHASRALAAPGQRSNAALFLRSVRGFSDSIIESHVLPSNGISRGAWTILQTAIDQGLHFVAFGPDSADALEDLDFGEEPKARILDAILQGHLILVPAEPLIVGGQPAIAWLELDLVTGEMLAVSQDGGHQSAVEYSLQNALIIGALLGAFVATFKFYVLALDLPPRDAKRRVGADCNLSSGGPAGACIIAAVTPSIGGKTALIVAARAFGPALVGIGCGAAIAFAAIACALKFLDPPLGVGVQDPELVDGDRHRATTVVTAPGNLSGSTIDAATSTAFSRIGTQVQANNVAFYPSAVAGLGSSGIGPGVVNFASSEALPANGATVNLDAVGGALSVGSSPLPLPTNLGLTAFTGSLSGSDNGPTDTVQLSGSNPDGTGSYDRVLVLSMNPRERTTDQNAAVTFTPTIQSNADDTYNLTAEAPADWTVQIDTNGTTSVTPAAGLSSGTYEVRFSVQSESVSDLRSDTSVYVTVGAPSAAIAVTIEEDDVFSVPDEGTLAQSNYRIQIQNLSTTEDTFDVSLSGLPAADFTQAVDSVVVGPGETGVVGVAVHPSAGLIAAGTPISFTVTATGQTTGLIDSASVSFPYPQVVGVRPSFNPDAVAAIPLDTVDADLMFVPASNVDETFTLTVHNPGGLMLSPPLPAQVTLLAAGTCPALVPSGPCIVHVTAQVPMGAPLGTTSLTVTADLCNGTDPCTVPLPSQRFAQLAVLIGSAETTCILEGAVVARSLDLDDFAAVLEDMGNSFSRLAGDRTDVLLQERALATGSAVVALLREANRTALADDLDALLVEIASGNDSQIMTAFANACTTLSSLQGELTQIGSERVHGFTVSLVPSGHNVTLNEPAQYTLRLESIGTLDSTINLSVPGLPPGVTAQLSQTSVTLEPKQLIDDSSGTPITLTLTSSAERVPALGFTLSGQVQEAPSVVATTRGLLGVRTSAVDVVAVHPAPQVVNAAGTPVKVTAELLNSANASRTVGVTLRVEDSTGTTVFTGTPVSVSLATGSATTPVDLGSVDTTGFPDGAFTAIVTAQNDTGGPLPGRQGRGLFIVGLPLVASALVEPAEVPPGSPEHVVSKVNVRARSMFLPGTGFRDQYAKAITDASLVTSAADALGPPDHLTASVAAGGSLVLDMGADLDRLADGPGADFVVFERVPNGERDTSICDKADDGAYTVDVSDDVAGPFTPVGVVSGPRQTGDEFDLAAVGLTSARFVRITPMSSAVSIDSVLAAHTHRPGGIHLEHFAPIGGQVNGGSGIVEAPVVGDINEDGHPDIVVATETSFQLCDVVAIDGVTKAEEWRYPLPQGRGGPNIAACGNLTSPAIADFDGDGHPNVVVNPEHSGQLGTEQRDVLVLRGDGTVSAQFPVPFRTDASVALENLVGDARPEIMWGAGFFQNDGTYAQLDNGFTPYIPVDLNGDMIQEIVGADGILLLAYTTSGSGVRPPLWATFLASGINFNSTHPVVADLNGDGKPDLVGAWFNRFTGFRSLAAVTFDGSILWQNTLPPPVRHCSVTAAVVCTQNTDCPSGETCTDANIDDTISRPAIADLNGDGQPDIVTFVRDVSTDNHDAIIAYDRNGNELWQTRASDPHGLEPGISTADLDGDGIPEVLWNGVCSGFTVLDGRTGKLLYRDPRIHSLSAFGDFPVAADVDADGHIDVVAGDSRGLYIFSDPVGWGGGRRLWNQVDYRITNINDDLTVPAVQPESWKWHNTYLFQGAAPSDLAQATVTIDHLLGADVTIQTAEIDPTPASVTGQQIEWTETFALSMGRTFSAGVDLPALRPGESHVVSESTTVTGTLSYLNGQTVPTSLTLDPVVVVAPHIIGVEPESLEVAPGATAVYGVRLRNVRSVAEMFTLSVVGVDPGDVTLPSSTTLAPDAETVLPLAIATSPATSAGAIDFSVVATGDQGTVDEAGGQMIISGSLARGVSVALIPINDTAGQGTSGLFRVVVTNTGNSTQTLRLSAALPAGITADFQTTLISVPPGLTGSRETIVTLTAAQGTPAGDVVFTVTATSTSDPTVMATAQGTLTVRSTGVAIDLQPNATLVAPQDGTVFTATVTNTGVAPDTFNLSLAGPVAVLASLASESISLQPGASLAVPITVTNLEPFLLQRTFLVAQVSSTTDPLVQANDLSIVDVGAFRGVTAGFEFGQTATGCTVRTDMALLITNAGNAGDERYTMAFSSSPPGVTFTPATTRFLVPPFKTARIPISVMPPGPGVYQITATVSTDGQPLCIVPPCSPLPGEGTMAQVQLTTINDGLACDDHSACTLSDTCVNGVCVGNLIDCSGVDECHDPGICDPLSGCPNKSTDGTPCDDGSVCTSGDTCQSGICTGPPAVSCGPCQTCDPVLGCTGSCTPTPAATATPTMTPTPTPTAAPPLDHFECHKSKLATGQPAFMRITGLSLVDHFGPLSVNVRGPARLCNPSNKNDEDPTAPTHLEHLAGYKLKQAVNSARFAKVRDRVVENQFGSLTIDLLKPSLLLVPSAKSLSSSPPQPSNPVTDHFTCYKAHVSKGAPAFVPVLGVSIEDQFGPTTVDVLKPRLLCAPTNKANEDPGAEAHPDYLMCYKVKAVAGSPHFSPISPVFVNDQLGPETLQITKPREICLPSLLNATPVPTSTPTPVPPMGPSNTPTVTGTPTATGTASATRPTRTRTPTATSLPSGTPTQTGTVTPTTGDVVDTILIGGPPVTVTITQPGQIARLVFGGNEGQRILLTKSGIAGTVQITDPDGGMLVPASPTDFVDTQTLPTSGIYTIVLIPNGMATGSITVTLYGVPPDVTGTIPTTGEPVTVSIPVPGRNARLTFDGIAGQRVSLEWINATVSCCSNALAIVKDASILTSTTVDGATGFIEPLMLPQTGTYAVTFDPSVTHTGNVTLMLHDVTNITGSITPGGPPVTVSVTIPGQTASLTFSGTADQRVSLLATASERLPCCANLIQIDDPNAAPLAFTYVNRGGTEFLGPQLLEQTGTYTIHFDPDGNRTGSVTFTLYDVVDITGTIMVSGPPVNLNFTIPGQIASLTFSGTDGQQVNFDARGSTLPCCSNQIRIDNPDASTLAFTDLGGSSASISSQTLTQTGTYTLVVDPNSGKTGSVNVSACTGITLSALPTTIAAGGSLTVDWSGICVPSPTDWIALYAPGAPDTTYLTFVYTTGAASGSISFPIPSGTAAGTYELRLHPNDTYAVLATSNSFTVGP